MATRPQLHPLARLSAFAMACALAWPLAWAGPVSPYAPTGPEALRLATAAPAPAGAQAKPGAPTVPIKMAPPSAGLMVARPEPLAPVQAAPVAPAAPALVAAPPAPVKPMTAGPATGKAVTTVEPNAPAATERARGRASAVGCIISPERVAEIGSPVVGIVRALGVDTGDTVRSGQALVTLQSDVESAGVQAAQARSAIDADVRAAVVNLELARQRHVRAIDLQAQGFVSPQAIDQAKAEMDVAAQKLQLARGQHTVAQRELGVVRAHLDQRVVKSPFDGVITERYVSVGERVEDRPLLRLAMLDPLRVELVMPANRYGTVARNDTLSVQPELPNVQAVTARVTHVDKVIDAASNTFRVRLSVPNPGNKLPAGARCKLLSSEPVTTQVSASRQPG